MDERFIQMKTILTLYLQEANENVKGLERSKGDVIDSHATYGPSSVLSSQALGMFYFMIGENMVSIDKLDSAFKAYIGYLEMVIKEKGVILDDEAGRLKTMWESHLVEIEKARKTLEDREIQIQGLRGAEEKDVLGAIAMKYTEETNYILRLNNVLSLYADYVGYLEEKLNTKGGFLSDDLVATMLKDIYLGLEKQFEFEVERACPKCNETVTVSPQNPNLICPFCGENIGL